MPTARRQTGSEIAGYRIDSLIGSGSKGYVYKAFKNNQPYALKIITNLNENKSGEILNFNRETAVAARFRHPVITRVFDFGQESNIYYIAMELADGVTLQEKLKQGPLQSTEALKIGIALASALQEVHNFGFIHRDVKPENIVLCYNGDIKLIDFGLAGSISDLSMTSVHVEAIGTFDYAAPEQAGVLQRAVDGRSDLYSIGVVLYQCLAGELPFFSKDLSQLLLMLAQQKPQPIREILPQASVVLEKILEKLLEKDPEARYQSAAGLLFDLQNLENLEQVWLEKKTVNLASQDLSVSGAIRLPLFGREIEVSILRRQLKNAIAGRGCGAVVEGEGGMGKSRLARELVSDATRVGLPVLFGKCSAQEQDVPYAVFRQALEHYLHRIKQMPLELREKHEERIREAAQNSKSIVLGLCSSMQIILGPRSPQESALDSESFAMGVRNFFCDLADLNQGMVLHLDDIQWMDAGSLSIIKSIFEVISSKKFFILATARNDQQSQASLEAFVQSTGREALRRLVLKPLDLPMTGEIAKSFLGGHEVALEITKKLFAFSNGNPFILTENISRLISSGVLRILDGKWQLNQADFASVGLSENVYDLILERISKLGSQVQTTLQSAAAMGHSFSGVILAKVLSMPENSMKDCLNLAVRAGVVEMPENLEYRFVHDRIREALLSTLGSEAVKDMNDRLADVFEKISDRTDSQAYEFARFIAMGHMDRNPERAFHAFLQAGLVAKAANASLQAFDYFSQAATFEKCMKMVPATHLSFLMDFAVTSTELGRVDSADEILERALGLTNDSLEKARILNLKSQALAHVARYSECWNADLELLKKIGQGLPQSGGRILLSLILTLAKQAWISLPPFRRAKTETLQSHCLLSANIYERLTITGYFTGQKAIMILVGLRFLYYTRLLGPSIHLVRAHGYVAQLAGVIGFGKWMRFHLHHSNQVAKQLGTKVAILLSTLTEAMSRERLGEDRLAEQLYVEGMPDIEKYLTTMNFGLAWGGLGWFYYLRGKNHESVALVRRNLPRTDRLNRLGGMVTLRFILYHQYLILGRRHEAQEVYQFILNNISLLGPGNLYVMAKLRASEFVSQFELGEITPEIDLQIEAFEEYKFDSIHHHLYYAYIGYIRLHQYQHAIDDVSKERAFEQLGRQLRTIRKISKVPFGRSHYFILKAAHQRIQKQYSNAERSLLQADKFAQLSDSAYARFMLLKEKSRLAEEKNLHAEAQLYSRMAYEKALQNSWPLRAQQVAQEFSIPTDMYQTSRKEPRQNSAGQVDQADRIANSLLRISLVASLEMNSQKQIQFSLDEIVKVMDAERSYVFLWNSSENALKYAGGRDSQGQDQDEPIGYSSTVVNKVAETKQSLIVMGDEQMEALRSTSAVVNGLRGIIAAPLLLKGELKGVVYVDSSVSKVLFTDKDIELLSAIASHIAIAFENLRMMNIEASKREMQKDLELSAAVQTMLFPKEQEFRKAGLKIFGFNRPAVQCGGDWWWHEMTDSKTLRIFVGDVTGHGAAPAMITSFLAACFKMGGKIQEPMQMTDLLSTISSLLFDLTQGDYLVSAVGIEINMETRTLSCWNCGAPGIYILQKGGTIVPFGNPGSLIGGSEFEVAKIETSLQPGDRIFIPTDGLMEQALPDGRPFGDRRTLKVLEKTRGLPIAEVLPRIVKELDAHRAEVVQDDDITMIYLEVLAENTERA